MRPGSASSCERDGTTGCDRPPQLPFERASVGHRGWRRRAHHRHSSQPRLRTRTIPRPHGRTLLRHQDPRRPAQRRDRRPRRPRQDDAARRHALAVRRLPRRLRRQRARHGLDGPRAREGDHDPRQEHVGRPRRREAQHHRHAGPRRLRRRGRARADDGRRDPPARRRLRGPAAPDPLRAAQGARAAAAGDPRDQQGRPSRRADRRGRRRGLRALPRPRRRRVPDRLPDRLHERQGPLGVDDGGRGGNRPEAAHGPDGRADPRAHLRGGPPAAGAGHEPRRLPLRRPPRPLPRPPRDDPGRPGRRLVPRGRDRHPGQRDHALHDPEPRTGRDRRRPGRARSSPSPASPR